MTVPLPRRRSRIVFWIAVSVILSAIVATALLANDKRNLRLIAERYRLSWLEPPAPTPAPPPEAARPAPPATAPAPARTRTRPKVGRPVSPHLIDASANAPSRFLRRWKVSGTALCSRLADAGFAVGGWHPSAFDPATFECSYETPAPVTAGSQQPSLFVIVRGTANGTVGNVRIKAILPETPAGDTLRAKFQALFHTIVRQTQWREINDATDSIDRLENVTQIAFGTRFVFAHEYANPRRFNLIIELEKPDDRQSATADFFDKSKWLPLPSHP